MRRRNADDNAALLQPGAGRVIATLWPVLDAPAAAEVSRRITADERGNNNNLSLGDVQRHYLHEWKTGDGSIPPHHFAAHAVIGSHRSLEPCPAANEPNPLP